MRDIKFRGKSLFKSEWWEGYYIYSKKENKHFIVQDAFENNPSLGSMSFSHFAEVYNKTIGQYTGLKDKNGTEIYEGDILKHEKYNSMGAMEWDIENGCWTKFYPLCFFEVIGNIHENPELLK